MTGYPAPLARLSRPISDLDGPYDVVVIGSGYGGAIAASRLARAGRRVAVLERGREVHPGQFPRTVHAASHHLQMSTTHRDWLDRSGLFWFHADGDMSVLSGCGLGGTSLINANVALRPDPRLFQKAEWPAAFREDPNALDEGFRRAEGMLQPQAYPADGPPLAKMAALRDLEPGAFTETPINVRFTSGPNAAGVHQEACTGCGDCVAGCNYGSKSTLLMNYLPDAAAHGAAMFTEMDVRWIERDGTGWVVMTQLLSQGRHVGDLLPVPAEAVVLAAGSLGSTALLLRSAARGLQVSAQLGRRFSGNGDVLAYAMRPGHDVNAVGAGPERADRKHPAGACITAMLDERPGRPLEDGIIIEDAVIPGALAPLVPGMLLPQLASGWLHGTGNGGATPLATAESAVTRGRHGALQKLQTFLVMGHDDAGGAIVLGDDGEPAVQWKDAGRSPYFTRVNARLAELATEAGGSYLRDPISTPSMGDKLITVHPLGGCAMADRAEDGVVDDKGRVFAGAAGDSVHQGLYVWDGSILPGPVGVNPLLTISALAERAVEAAAVEHGWSIDYGSGLPYRSAAATAAPVERGGLRFSEHMAGWWDPTANAATATVQDFLDAAAAGESAARELSFVLTMFASDVDHLSADMSTPLQAVGSVRIDGLDAGPLLAEHGCLRLIMSDDPDPSVQHMRYEIPLVSGDGRSFFLEGFKNLEPGDVTNAWPATTTLYATVRADGPEGAVLGRGVLRIDLLGFARLLRSMAITGDVSEATRLEALARFGRAFAGPLLEDYGTVVHHTVHAVGPVPARSHRPLRVPVRQTVPYRSADGLDLRLTRYRGGDRGPVVLSHGMGANPLTFSVDTAEPNLVEYLVAHGFDVWLQEWRGSTLLPTSTGSFDADQVANLDHPAAEQAIREQTGRSDLHWVTHCVGSMTVTMSVLRGVVTPASLLCSQVAAHPVGPMLMRWKAALRLAPLLRRMGVRLLTTDSWAGESVGGRLFDQALRLYPVPATEECDQAVCRRLAFIYGVAVHHGAVDPTTHTVLHELFGRTNLEMMSHLALCAHHQQLRDVSGGDTYTVDGAVERLRMPLTLLHGARNLVWLPESTRRTQEWVDESLGSGWCRREVFAGHGHQDTLMGADSHRDVFPSILAHLDWAGA